MMDFIKYVWNYKKNIIKLQNTNSGHWNSGDRNSGSWNSGNWNSRHWNSGHGNSGHWNSGNWNSRHWNSGNCNSGSWNSGDRNSGHWNSGNWNSGHGNSGHWNSGNWNSGNWNSGILNTTNPNMRLFNTEIPISVCEFCERYEIPDFFYFDLTKWINSDDMCLKEKDAHPDHMVLGGYLRSVTYEEAWRASWNSADDKDRRKVLELPHFNNEIFKEISGIDVYKELNIKEGDI